MNTIDDEEFEPPLLIGAIAGDVIGSVFEEKEIKSTDFELFTERSTFTDDTVLTIALAESILENKNTARTFQEYGKRFPNAGYGFNFFQWIFMENPRPYNSWGMVLLCESRP